MTDRNLVLAIFENEASADQAAQAMKDADLTSGDAMGILVLDANGKLKEEKVGARSTGKGAGIGGVLFLLGPAAVGVGVVGGAAAGALHHKGLGLDLADKERISAEVTNGKAALGVLTPVADAGVISRKMTALGGTPEVHEVTEEGLQTAAAASTTS